MPKAKDSRPSAAQTSLVDGQADVFSQRSSLVGFVTAGYSFLDGPTLGTYINLDTTRYK